MNPTRLLDLFCEIVRIESPSRREAAMAARCADELRGLGFSVRFDDSAAQTGADTGNLVAHLPGTAPGHVVLSAHMDTVQPCAGIEPVVEDGVVRSAGDTILSADDKAGIAEIITVESDMVNVDFADVSKVMRDSGRAHMSVATAEGEHRAAEVARASLESPLLDHTLISGAKNILLNISTSDADSLALDEVMEILKYIQSHASVQAPDGTVHDANIIWGTSVKPQLGRRIELVVVATGFDSAAIERAAKPVVPPADVLAAQPREENTVLEPIKPRPVPTLRPMTQVMLGERPTRYKNIEAQLAVPAYRTRKAELIVETSTSRKEVLKEEGDAAAKPPQEKGGSLFD